MARKATYTLPKIDATWLTCCTCSIDSDCRQQVAIEYLAVEYLNIIRYTV